MILPMASNLVTFVFITDYLQLIMKRKKSRRFLLLIGLFILASCSKNEDNIQPFENDPMQEARGSV